MDAEFAQLTKAFKGIVKNYLDNEKISDVVYATYTGGSLVIDNRPIPVPLDMVDIPLHLQTITGLLSCDLSLIHISSWFARTTSTPSTCSSCWRRR